MKVVLQFDKICLIWYQKCATPNQYFHKISLKVFVQCIASYSATKAFLICSFSFAVCFKLLSSKSMPSVWKELI